MDTVTIPAPAATADCNMRRVESVLPTAAAVADDDDDDDDAADEEADSVADVADLKRSAIRRTAGRILRFTFIIIIIVIGCLSCCYGTARGCKENERQRRRSRFYAFVEEESSFGNKRMNGGSLCALRSFRGSMRSIKREGGEREERAKQTTKNKQEIGCDGRRKFTRRKKNANLSIVVVSLLLVGSKSSMLQSNAGVYILIGCRGGSHARARFEKNGREREERHSS
eukprot:scaffold3823_cov195-Amphora_coffeaeformis.AAC.7